MGEPAFYRCKACSRTWERFEMKLRRNPPAVCPSCGSGDQETDEAKEREYVREVYGPIAKIIGDAINKKLDG
jgi:DNA-directed RNA polymerase subunit RPC12/RpoP